jgi:hypothetical protein
MNLHETQKAIFRLYLNSGYRLAHKLDPKAFAEFMGLSGEDADLVIGLDPRQLDNFSSSLMGKRRTFYESVFPVSYHWMRDHHPVLLRDFLELYNTRRFAEEEPRGHNFVAYVRECSLFYPDIPRAVADVAQFELIMITVKKQQTLLRAEARRSATESPVTEFSWDSLCWKPARSMAAEFTVDPLLIVLERSDMDQPPNPTSVVVTPSLTTGPPTVLRVLPIAATLVNLMAEPMTGHQLLAHCQDSGIDIAPDKLGALLTKLVQHGVIDHYCPVPSHV